MAITQQELDSQWMDKYGIKCPYTPEEYEAMHDELQRVFRYYDND